MTTELTAGMAASMYAEVVRGVSIENSRHAGGSPEAHAMFVRVAAEVAAARAVNPAVEFDVPNEIPAAAPRV